MIAKILSKYIPVPRVFAKRLMKTHGIKLEDVLIKSTDMFVSLDTIFLILEKNISEQQLKVDKTNDILKTKNTRIDFRNYTPSTSKTLGYDNNYLQRSTKLNSNNKNYDVKGIVVNSDVGFSVQNIISEWSPVDWDESIPKEVHEFLYLTLDREKAFPIVNNPNTSSTLTWNNTTNQFEIKRAKPLEYEFNTEDDINQRSKVIIINHNLASRGIRVDLFSIDKSATDYKTPIEALIEYPSDNQCRIYLSWEQPIHVLIFP